ncbi:pentapeptide repeat-containing protein [Campylobacter jejuni]|nr:pentapeptide repeat-containing protein [Campylobacter jejuni]EAK0972736.1 pentapeptide repeat-containing protein [Campylobacter jejuni]
MNNEEDIKFENYIKGEAKLNSEKQYIIESSCRFNANNDNFKRHYDENKILEIHLNNMVFEQDLSFDNVKKLSLIIDDNVKFQKLYIFGCNELSLRINGRVKIIDKISINNCKFKQISINNHIDGNIEFQNCEFNDFNLYGFSNATIKGTFTFDFCEVKEKVNFMNFEFENKVSFKMSKFKDNVYFNNSVFKDYADFHECEFEKIACFYGVRFDKTPNFSQAIFKGNLNVVNTNLNFTFDDLQERIKQEYTSYETQRTAKEAGVIPNLYQEKSLDKFANDFRDSFRTFKNALIKDNNALDASNFHKCELYCKEIELKNKKYKTLKDKMDKWQLIFYRKLCDHHTDILQSLNSLILVIGIFVISSVAMVVGFSYSLGYKPILEHWYFSLDFYNHHINSIIQDNCLLMIFVNLMILFIYLGLVGFALCIKYMREFFIIISYVITLLVLAISPKILIPAMGIFTDKRAILDPLSVLGGIYTIIFGFVAFSFIKTIRKNSIVPS